MKILSTIFFFLIIPIAHGQPGNSTSLSNEGIKVFEDQFGTITYKVTQGGEGNVTFLFDQYGLLSSTDLDLEFTLYGIETSLNERTIRDGEFLYIYDLERLSGRQKKIKTEVDLLRYKSMKEAREALFSINGGQKTGTEIILDKETEHWIFESGPVKEAWYWKGLTLKASIKRPKVSYTYEAISIDLTQPGITYPDITISEK